MTKFYFSLISVFLIGCASFETGPEKLFLYEFEKNDKLNQSTITNTIDVLTKRLDKFGVNQVEISVNNKQQIEIKTKVELKQNALNNLIENSGKLEFWETYKGNEFNSFISEINSYLNEESEDHDALNNPLSDLIIDKGYPGGPVIFNVKTEDTSTVNTFLKNSKAKFFLPQDRTKTKFLWGKAYAGKHSLYAIKSNEENKAPIRSIHIVEANQNYDMRGKPAISIEMNGEGGSRFEELTEIVFRNQSNIAIVLNDVVYTAPGVTAGPITGGRCEITGNFTLEQAQNLSVILSSGGSIPKLKFLRSSIVEKAKY